MRPLRTCAALALSLALAANALGAPPAQKDPGQSPAQSSSQDDPRRTPVVRVVEQAAPAVVSIVSARVVEQAPFSSNNPFGRLFESLNGPQQKRRITTQNLGSGVIIDGQKALVLTNAHVIAEAGEITVRLMDGREFTATLMGSDPDMDLAVLHLQKASRLPQAAMGDSDALLIGEPLVAIGNPFGFSHSVTTGILSALNRSVNTQDGAITGLLQTDAAINPGNSGGPLLNILGQVVGINTAIYAKAEGIGFAIPVNSAKRVLSELINTGRVAHIWLGLLGENMDQDAAAYFGLTRVRGMTVTDVFPDTPAAAAGIKPGDALLSINAIPVQDKAQFRALLLNYSQGDTLTVQLRRGRAPYTVTLRPVVLDRQSGLGLVLSRWGFAPGREDQGGLLVDALRPGGPMARAGFRPGDVIVQVGNLPTHTEADLLSAFFRYQMHNVLMFKVKREEREYNVRLVI